MSEEHKNKGNEAFKAKNFQEAIENFSKGIECDVTNHILYSNRSASYASLNQWEAALKDAQKCVELNPGWAKGYTRLGAAQFGKRNLTDAIESYKKALALDPSNDTIKESIKQVENAETQAVNPFAKIFGPDTFTKIQQNPKLSPYLSDPAYVQSINTIVNDPNSMQMFMKDARIQTTMIELLGLSAGMPGMGTGGFTPTANKNTRPPTPPKKKEEQISKDPSILAKEKGNTHYKKREFQEALQCYDEAIALDPSNGVFYLNKSSVLFETREYEACLKLIEEAMELFQSKSFKEDYVTLGKILTRKAQVLQTQQNYDEAIHWYKKALLEHRNGTTLTLMNACESEKKNFLASSYVNPELSQEAKERGNVAFRENRYPEAVSEYSEAIKRNPKDHILYSNRAAAYMKLGANDDAVKDCETCLSIDENFIKAIVRLAHCYFFRKEFHRAIQYYERGLKIDPAHEECLEGVRRTRAKISEAMYSGEVDEERVARAKNDPEVRDILADSYMQFVLREMSMNPGRAEEFLSDANIAHKIQKLIAAGILSFGGPEGAENKKK